MGTAARSSYLNLDDSGGTPQDLSSYFEEFDQNDDVGMEESTTFGASVTAKSRTVTLTDGGFTLKGPWGTAVNNHLKALIGLTATSTFIIGPIGSTGGNPKITGECRLKSLKRNGKVDGILNITAEFMFDGTKTETTF